MLLLTYYLSMSADLSHSSAVWLSGTVGTRSLAFGMDPKYLTVLTALPIAMRWRVMKSHSNASAILQVYLIQLCINKFINKAYDHKSM